MLAFSGRNGETWQLSLDDRRGGATVPAQGEQLGEGERGDKLGIASRQFICMDSTEIVYG